MLKLESELTCSVEKRVWEAKLGKQHEQRAEAKVKKRQTYPRKENEQFGWNRAFMQVFTEISLEE